MRVACNWVLYSGAVHAFFLAQMSPWPIGLDSALLGYSISALFSTPAIHRSAAAILGERAEGRGVSGLAASAVDGQAWQNSTRKRNRLCLSDASLDDIFGRFKTSTWRNVHVKSRAVQQECSSLAGTVQFAWGNR